MLVGYLLILLCCYVQYSGGLDAFLEFHGSRVRDDTVISVGIGRPMRLVKLRAVFSPELFDLGLHAGNIILFDSTAIRLQSATYEVVVPNRLGRDIIDVDGVRWTGLIDTVQSESMPASHSSYRIHNGKEIDGLIYVGPRSDTHVGSGFWQAMHVTGQGIRWFPERQDTPSSSIPLRFIAPHQMAVDANLRCLFDTFGLIATAEVADATVNGVPHVRLLVAPDHAMSYLSSSLFDDYFYEKNFYVDTPERWNPLTISVSESNVSLAIPGHVLFPRQAASMNVKNGYSGGRGGKIIRAIVSIEGAMMNLDAMEKEYSVSRDELLTASAGIDNIKLLSHACGENIIALGGHVLWSTGALEITYYPVPSIALAVTSSGTVLTLVDSLLFIAIVVLYVRWKLGALWIDSATDKKLPSLHHHYAVTTIDSHVVPAFSQFIAVPLLLFFYFSTADVNLPSAHTIHVTVALAVAWVGATGMWLIGENRIIRYVLYVIRRHAKEQNLKSMFWTTYGMLSGDDDKSSSDNSSKTNLPSDRHERQIVRRWSDLPEAANAQIAWKYRPRGTLPFVWHPLCLSQLRDALLEASIVLALWFVVAPLESKALAFLFSGFLLALLAFSLMHRVVLLLYLTVSPMITPGYRVRGRGGPLLCLMILALATADITALTVQVALRPTLEAYSSLYTNSDGNLDVIEILFIVSLFFLALVVAPRTISALLLPKRRTTGKV